MSTSISAMSLSGLLQVGAAALVIGCSACSFTGPSCTDQYGRGSTSLSSLDISCSTIGSNLQCQAVASNKNELYVYCPMQQDVTQSADWMVGDSSIAKNVGPGLFVAAGIGDTFVSATWRGLASNMRALSVFADTAPLPTYEIFGSVWQAGQTPTSSYIDGAVIQILNGLVAGRTATTGVPPPLPPGYLGPFGGKGYFRLLGVPPGTYRVRITKDGYASQERDVTVVGPGSPVVDFQLQPI
jgi:hypothetical protein